MQPSSCLVRIYPSAAAAALADAASLTIRASRHQCQVNLRLCLELRLLRQAEKSRHVRAPNNILQQSQHGVPPQSVRPHELDRSNRGANSRRNVRFLTSICILSRT
jgi:hypothetical protein